MPWEPERIRTHRATDMWTVDADGKYRPSRDALALFIDEQYPAPKQMSVSYNSDLGDDWVAKVMFEDGGWILLEGQALRITNVQSAYHPKPKAPAEVEAENLQFRNSLDPFEIER